jgi:hypothetical protein
MPRRILSIVSIITIFIVSSTVVIAGERFTDNGDGTVTDHQLGVMWGKTDNQGDINWHQADKWVKYTFPYTIEAKYDNWRMPTLAELKSLFVKDSKGYEADCGKKVKIAEVIELSCGWVWTSEKKSITARVFYFKGGYHHLDRMVHNRGYRALAVRDLN